MMDKQLPPRQEEFIRQYVIDKNATQAAIRAGYSEKTANEQASRLLANVNIRQRVDELLAQVNENAVKKAELNKQWIIEQLIDNALIAKAAEPVLDAEGNPIGEYKANISASNKALELLGKEIGMFIDKSERGKPGDFERLQDDELEKRLHENERAIAELARTTIRKAATAK